MSKANFFSGITWLVLLNVVVKPVWLFGVDRQVQNIVGHEAYGVYFSILSLSVILSFVADLGLTNLVNRQLALNEGINIKKLVLSKVVLSILYLILVFLVAFISGIKEFSLLLLIVLIQILTSFLLFFRSIITANQFFKTDAWISIIDKLLMVVILLPLLYIFPVVIDLFDFLKVQLLTLVFTIIITVIVTFRMQSSMLSNKNSINFKMTMPFIFIFLFMTLLYRLGGFLLERLHVNGAYEAGIYASAFRVTDAGNMLGYLVASFLVPFTARNLKQTALLETTVVKLRWYVMLLGGSVMVYTIMYSNELVRLLYNYEEPFQSQVLILSISSLPALYLLHIYGSLLTAKGSFNSLIFIIAGGVVLNTLMNLFFIPAYGARACSWAALVSLIVSAVVCFVVATNKLKISFSLASFIVSVLIISGLYFLFYFLKWQQWSLLFSAIAGFCVLLLAMFVNTDSKNIFKKLHARSFLHF
jgi:O-antigen/teichoic acid export membrane protein